MCILDGLDLKNVGYDVSMRHHDAFLETQSQNESESKDNDTTGSPLVPDE